jgi:hypothetical protein
VIEGMVTFDTLPFRQELRGAFNSYGYDYYDDDDGDTPHRKVNEIAAVASRFALRSEWGSAAAIYRTILEEFAELEEGSYYDEEGELAYAISEVVGQLGDCERASWMTSGAPCFDARWYLHLGCELTQDRRRFGCPDIVWHVREHRLSGGSLRRP